MSENAVESDPVTDSLMQVAEEAGDITARIYEHYFAASPASAALMEHVDEIGRGKMMAEVFRLVMLNSFEDESEYLNWEVLNHERAYSVEPAMYEPLFDALIATVKESLGDRWDDALAAAWQERTRQVSEEFTRRFS